MKINIAILTNTLLTAALGLTMTALPVSAQVAATAVTKISALPFPVPISGGTFVLTSDLTCSTTPAIAIPLNITAPVLLDLRGHTITGAGASSVGVGIGPDFAGPFAANPFPITVRNGTIQNVSFAVFASGSQFAPLSDLTIGDLAVSMVQPPSGNAACIVFGGFVQNSTVRNCTFNQGTYGIEDILSPGGNRYTNISMNRVGQSLWVEAAQAAPTVLLEDCEFAAPTPSPTP